MTEPALSKQNAGKIGKTFALLFNRALMYDANHPSTKQTAGEFHKTISIGLNELSPIVFIMAQEQFFVEDEPLDPRINTGRMLSHFKNGGIQSVSFEKGIKDADLKAFSKIFFDATKYTNADAMKSALAKEGITKVKINHVIFKKVTADDEVVSRDKLNQAPAAAATAPQPQTTAKGKGLDVLAESVVMQELEKSLTLKNLLENPSELSKSMIDNDREASGTGPAKGEGSGPLILQQLRQIGNKVAEAGAGQDTVNFEQLADAVFGMKQELLKGMENQKAMGAVYQNEGMIRDETNEITDNVIIQLVKEEYKKGQISIPRLGQVLRRMVPEVGELRRLMPKLKQTLLKEGMPLSEFAQLTQELGKELQNEELAQVLEKSAEEIGVAGADLIDQIKYDPKGAAELIYLASEIRKGTGDEKVLSDVLVDYVERVGSNIAMDAAKQKGEEGNNHLREIVSQVESELVGSLKSKGVDTNVLNKVEQRLEQRMDQCLNKLESDWMQRSTSSAAEESTSASTALQLFEKSVEGDAALKPILEKVRSSLQAKGIDENDYQKIYEEISKSPTVAEKIPKPKPVVRPPQKGLPPGVLNRKSLLFFIEKEILRSHRYDTPFSIITFSILRATPRKPVRKGSITREHITNAVLQKLVSLFREVDIIGYLDKTKMIAVLPMTEEKFGRKAMARVMKLLHEDDYYIGEAAIEIKFVAQVTAFDSDRTDNLKAFMRRAETDILNMANRLKNIQSLY
jgi:hypothetical protein